MFPCTVAVHNDGTTLARSPAVSVTPLGSLPQNHVELVNTLFDVDNGKIAVRRKGYVGLRHLFKVVLYAFHTAFLVAAGKSV